MSSDGGTLEERARAFYEAQSHRLPEMPIPEATLWPCMADFARQELLNATKVVRLRKIPYDREVRFNEGVEAAVAAIRAYAGQDKVEKCR